MDIIINHIIEILVTVFASILIFIYNKIKKLFSTIEANKESIISLTKNVIIEKFFTCKKRNCISIEEKELIISLFSEYKKLGGNGVIEKIIEDMNNIPVEENCE